ncbi:MULTISPECIES: condensation domain-containing protein [Gordonia]|uniref:Condensation domain-containing protein n=1 Tax=Gordonia amicalis TaxID=89053 RepID=A0AAE4RBQ2_9ACTN|nr:MULTISPECIES: condensation domain-containing protein [Gordonia]MCZ4580732.1 condensation domain-containing protein [Gordonia amicalis]MDJ0454608.1 condensation domain-containing protein [Gordonia amicalis]MDV6314050.1 condensation domain-containing protein [Gordonia amicalis]MDV7077822.1 condensation domain-containing protein [Gordonia amicalis]UPW13205.1 condensation domain-containing protein [Gordonia amicalis]
MSGTLQSRDIPPRFSDSGSLVARLRPHLTGGRAVEWELRDPDRVAKAAQRWGDGVSFLQSDHLATMAAKRREGEAHHGFIVAATRFDTPLVPDAMSAALTDFVRRHEELRAHYRSGPAGHERWVSPPDEVEIVTADRESVHVHDAELGDWVGGRAAETAWSDLVPGSWWGATCDDDGFTFFASTDHVRGDGYSLVLAMFEIVELYRGHCAGEPAELAAAGSFGDAILAERRIAASLDPADDRVAVWRDALVHNDGRTPSCPLDLGLTDGLPKPSVTAQTVLLDAETLARCDARIAATDGSFSGLIYAALAEWHRRMTGRDRFFVSTVLATRAPEHFWTQGWLCNFAPIAVEVPNIGDVDFDDLVRAAAQSVRLARGAAEIPAHAVLAQLAGEGVFRGLDGSPYMVSYTDLRRLPIGDDPVLNGTQLLTGLGPTRNANLWFTRTATGLDVVSQIPDNDVARTSILEQFATLREILAGYADAAGYATESVVR